MSLHAEEVFEQVTYLFSVNCRYHNVVEGGLLFEDGFEDLVLPALETLLFVVEVHIVDKSGLLDVKLFADLVAHTSLHLLEMAASESPGKGQR